MSNFWETEAHEAADTYKDDFFADWGGDDSDVKDLGDFS